MHCKLYIKKCLRCAKCNKGYQITQIQSNCSMLNYTFTNFNINHVLTASHCVASTEYVGISY